MAKILKVAVFRKDQNVATDEPVMHHYFVDRKTFMDYLNLNTKTIQGSFGPVDINGKFYNLYNDRTCTEVQYRIDTVELIGLAS